MEAGFNFYLDPLDPMSEGARMKSELMRWLSGKTDTVPTAWVETSTDASGDGDVHEMDFGEGGPEADFRLLGNTCTEHEHCAKNGFCLPAEEGVVQHEGGHCFSCKRCNGREVCAAHCVGRGAGAEPEEPEESQRESDNGDELRDDEEERDEL